MPLRLTFAAAFALALAACGPELTEPPTGQSPDPVSTPAESGSSVPSDLPCEVAQVFAKNCSSCHGTTPANGAPESLVTRADLLAESFRGGSLVQRSLERMKDTAVPMPPAYAGARVTSAELAAVESWVNAGLPAGSCPSVTTNPGP